MPLFRCNACRATFRSPQGRSLFFHECAPMSIPELIDAHDRNTQPFDPDIKALIEQAKVERVPGGDGSMKDGPSCVELQARRIRRDGHVNQNIVENFVAHTKDDQAPAKEAGAGVTEIGP